MMIERFGEPPTQVLGRIGADQDVIDELLLVLQHTAIQIDEMSIRCGHEQPAEAQYDADGHQREEERQAAGQR